MIYLGADHGGFELKEELKKYLAASGIEAEDMGATSLNPNDDYTDFIIPLVKKVASIPGSLGIIIGRSGNGEAIVANKIKEIRAALCLNEKMAEKARDHNNANILSLGADYISVEVAKKIVQTFLDTPFSNEERHIRRLKKIEELEKSQ
ncbi:MAG: ribose 5-phosphate isomerase B [Microgenomates group bacterium Gr01-1014_7]|nr:MAG: ribose 5-phosphate isomerase B [Microgenomates group bacterium Gr01-1014_7]